MKRKKSARRRAAAKQKKANAQKHHHPNPPAPPAWKKRTGVTRYDPDFAILICERIATTPQSLAVVCAAPDMPCLATLFRWLREYPDFRDLYVEAKQAQAELFIEEALEIVDDDSQDLIVTDEGRTIVNSAALRRCKMRVEFRKWIAAKLLPRKYGNHRSEPRSTKEAPPNPEDQGSTLTPERQRRVIKARNDHLDSGEPPEPPEPTEAPDPSPEPPSPISGSASDPASSAFDDTSEPPPPVVEPVCPPPIPPYVPPRPVKRWFDIPVPRRQKTTLNKAVS